MTLTADRDVDHYLDQVHRTVKVAGSTKVYKGSLVGLDSNGYAQPLEAADPFVGIAYEQADNSAGSDGAITVKVDTIGDFEHALSGAAQSNIGDTVYASAEDTLTFTSTDNSFVGYCVDVPESGTIILRLKEFGATTP